MKCQHRLVKLQLWAVEELEVEAARREIIVTEILFSDFLIEHECLREDCGSQIHDGESHFI
jgi:hypothetical protein